MQITNLKKLLDKVNLKQEVNLIQLRKIIEKMDFKNHRYADRDIKALKNPKTSLYQITHFEPALMQELQLLVDGAGDDRNSAAHQNMSHSHKVDGSFMLVRQGNEHPMVVTIDMNGDFNCPISQTRCAIVVENRQIFLYIEGFMEFLKVHTDIPMTVPMDVLFGAGNELPNSFHREFLDSYEELYLCLDMDLGGLRTANNLMRLLPEKKIHFVQPRDIEPRLKRVVCTENLAHLNKISTFGKSANPALKPYIQLIRNTGRTLEQESFL